MDFFLTFIEVPNAKTIIKLGVTIAFCARALSRVLFMHIHVKLMGRSINVDSVRSHLIHWLLITSHKGVALFAP